MLTQPTRTDYPNPLQQRLARRLKHPTPRQRMLLQLAAFSEARPFTIGTSSAVVPEATAQERS